MRLSRAERAERKRKRRNLVMGLVLVGIMLFSIIAFATFDQGFGSGNIIEFNGYEFTARQVQGGVLLFADIQGREIGFYADPWETTTHIVVDQEIRVVLGDAGTIVFASKPVTLAGQVGIDQAFQELLIRDLQLFSGKSILRAQTEQDVFMDYPLLDCSNASSSTPIIITGEPLQDEKAITSIEGYDYCFNLNSQGQDIILLRDYLILLLNGVVK